MIENCIMLEKQDIQEIIAEHFKVGKDSVIMHMSTATVKLPSTAKEGKANETD